MSERQLSYKDKDDNDNSSKDSKNEKISFQNICANCEEREKIRQ